MRLQRHVRRQRPTAVAGMNPDTPRRAVAAGAGVSTAAAITAGTRTTAAGAGLTTASATLLAVMRRRNSKLNPWKAMITGSRLTTRSNNR